MGGMSGGMSSLMFRDRMQKPAGLCSPLLENEICLQNDWGRGVAHTTAATHKAFPCIYPKQFPLNLPQQFPHLSMPMGGTVQPSPFQTTSYQGPEKCPGF